MTKADHAETVKAAKKFKKQLDETILADVKHGVDLSPFESEMWYTAGKVSQFLGRMISAFED